MSDDSLTPREVAMLLTLMAEAREVSNNELNERHSFSITGATKAKLNNLKFVESHKRGRQFAHELTDNGWARCREELSAGRPATARGASNGALYAILDGLGRFFDREDFVLADVFQAATPQPSASEPGLAHPSDPQAPADGDNSIEARIRAAYSQLARRPGELVRLSSLRKLLGEAAKSEVDKVLRQLDRSRVVTVLPEENQKTLTADDRKAAVKIGGQDNHLIKIESA